MGHKLHDPEAGFRPKLSVVHYRTYRRGSPAGVPLTVAGGLSLSRVGAAAGMYAAGLNTAIRIDTIHFGDVNSVPSSRVIPAAAPRYYAY
jgi:hypothetical protein